jgi:hypothetical protein
MSKAISDAAHSYQDENESNLLCYQATNHTNTAGLSDGAKRENPTHTFVPKSLRHPVHSATLTPAATKITPISPNLLRAN